MRLPPSTVCLGWSVLVVACPLAGAQTSVEVAPATAVIETFNDGAVDWTNGSLWAEGCGLYPERARTRGQARLMARRAALMDAYRALAEVVYGVRVDARSTMRDFVLRDDTVRTRVDALVRGARITAEDETADGYHVRLGIGLYGREGLAPIALPRRPLGRQTASTAVSAHGGPVRAAPTEAPAGMAFARRRALDAPSAAVRPADTGSTQRPASTPVAAVPSTATAQPTLPTMSVPRAGTSSPSLTLRSPQQPEPLFGLAEDMPGPYTGLLLDARSTEARPCMSPRIVAEDGSEVYGTMVLSREEVLGAGVVGWVRPTADPPAGELRCGPTPLIVRALDARGPLRGELVISNEDARRLREATAADGFLEARRVVIVLP